VEKDLVSKKSQKIFKPPTIVAGRQQKTASVRESAFFLENFQIFDLFSRVRFLFSNRPLNEERKDGGSNYGSLPMG